MSALKIPILPIPDMVFFPHTAIPVQITNPLAMRLVKDCVLANYPLAITLATNNNPLVDVGPKNICCMGTPIILEEDENQIKAVINGVDRIQLGKQLQHIPYPIFEFSFYKDRPDSNDFNEENYKRVRSILFNWLRETVLNPEERRNFLDNLKTPNHVIDYLCLFLIKDLAMRQIMLESQSMTERVEMLNILLQGSFPTSEDSHIVKILKYYDGLENNSKIAH